MGCDIHLYTERRVDGVWQTADKWRRDEYGRQDVDYASQLYTGRNYGLFSILANVRNGYGFAGADTGDGYRPIAMPRGVPEDASPEYRELQQEWGADGHSHSYFTVSELLAYDWTQVATRRGIVSISELARSHKRGRPDSWSGGIGGPGIRIFSKEEGVAAVEAALAVVEDYPSGREFDWWNVMHIRSSHDGSIETDPKPDIAERQAVFWRHLTEALGCPRPHFQVSWEEPYSSVASSFLSETMPRLWRLGPPDDVRIVFFFDN